MHVLTRSFLLVPALLLATLARPQAMGNLMYEQNSRIFFQQAEQPVKATVQGNMLVLEVNAMMNMRADSYLAIFHITQLGQSAEEADSLADKALDQSSASEACSAFVRRHRAHLLDIELLERLAHASTASSSPRLSASATRRRSSSVASSGPRLPHRR